MSEATPLVGIVMGSTSDMDVMKQCAEQLEAFGGGFAGLSRG